MLQHLTTNSGYWYQTIGPISIQHDANHNEPILINRI